MDLALSLLASDELDVLITGESSFEDLPNAPVDFLNGIAITATKALVFKFLGGEERHVRECVRKIKEERAFAMFVDEFDSF